MSTCICIALYVYWYIYIYVYTVYVSYSVVTVIDITVNSLVTTTVVYLYRCKRFLHVTGAIYRKQPVYILGSYKCLYILVSKSLLYMISI